MHKNMERACNGAHVQQWKIEVSLERVEFKISDMDDATKEVIEKPAPTSFTSRKYIIVKESFGELVGGSQRIIEKVARHLKMWEYLINHLPKCLNSSIREMLPKNQSRILIRIYELLNLQKCWNRGCRTNNTYQ